MKRKITLLIILTVVVALSTQAQENFILKSDDYKGYIDKFNASDNEIYKEYIPNDSAWSFLKGNIPLLDCPDKNIENTYYFRWWTYRKHIKKTPDGFIITEFLPLVSWSGKYNSISCAAAHHFYEGRWLKDTKILVNYANFWLKKGGDLRSYSFWVADALWAYHQVKKDSTLVTGLLPFLVGNYRNWEYGRVYNGMFIGKNADGMFTTYDDRDGMEMSIGGSGRRPTINSYMYGDARAIANIARLKGDKVTASVYSAKSDTLKKLVLNKLWDSNAQFFKTLRYNTTALVDVREILGYTPWYFNLPPQKQGYEEAWKFLISDKGFSAPYGLTTAEQSHPKFIISYSGHECQWNGPSWPFSTSVTLTAMANVLNNYEQTIISREDYFKQLQIYANAHLRVDEKGTVLPWIDEVINPYNGDWISRTMLKQLGWPASKGGVERGKDYNHSTFCDLVISGLIGLHPQDNDTVVINPLLPANEWDWFCLDNISYHGKTLTIVFDRYGSKYNKGKGLMCFVNGDLKVQSDSIAKLKFSLNSSSTAIVPTIAEIVKIYPNPVTDFLNICIPDEKTSGIRFSISNLLGEIVNEGEINATRSSIDMRSLSKGVYVVGVTYENRTETKTVVKK